ncbi:MAG TPA: hypothetical protein IAC02_03700 [Candidatus Coprovivens excrementavium]|nr:hypothetical protein [Candidatus Coprovivens excrementavium]
MSNEENVNKDVKESGTVNSKNSGDTTNNQQIISTEAAKAKANEMAAKAKAGVGNFTEKFKSDKKFKTNVIGIGIVVIVVIVLLVVYLTGGSKGAVKGFAKAYVKMDAKEVVKYMHEDYLAYYEDLDIDLEDSLDDGFDDLKDEDYEYLSYEINDSEKIEKDDVEDIAESLEELYDINENDVKAAVLYTIKFKVDDDGDKDTLKNDVTAVKISGKWYIFPVDLT